MFKIEIKMLVLLYAGIMILCCNCQEDLSYVKEKVPEEESTYKPLAEPKEIDIENAILKIEALSVVVQMVSSDGEVSEDKEKFCNRMIPVVEEITKAIKNSDNVYKFIKANGIIRVLSKNLVVNHSKLKTKLLLLLKDLFDTAPTTTEAVLPLNIVDRLLDIFENDNNSLKAHSLDLLYKWLPNNPEAQARVMKTKGLEPFYNQIDKLDVSVIQKLMELFNKILKEHLDARNDKAQVKKDDGERLVTYQRIGLLEHVSTPNVCNGMLNIFVMLWSFNKNESPYIETVFELIKNVKPFCLKIYMKNSNATDWFGILLKYVKDEDRKPYFEKHGINVTEFVTVIDEYMGKKNTRVKEEF